MSSLDDPKFATNTNYGSGPYSGQPNKARPPSGNIGEGFDPNAPLPTEWLNYLTALHGTWLASLRDGTVSIAGAVVDGTGAVVETAVPGQISFQQATRADTSLALFKDQGGNVRSYVDHVGYRMGRVTEWVENWDWSGNGIGAQTNLFYPSSQWAKWKQNSSANFNAATNAPNNVSISTLTSSVLNITSASPANTNSISFVGGGGVGMFLPQSYTSLVCEFEAALSITGTAASIDHKVGFSSSTTGPGTGYEIGVAKRSGDTTWQVYTSNNGTSTFTNTSAACTDLSLHRFRFELHGSASPYGSKARFFVDGNAVVEITTNLPDNTQVLNFMTASHCLGSGVTATSFVLSPVRAVWNRYLAPESF